MPVPQDLAARFSVGTERDDAACFALRRHASTIEEFVVQAQVFPLSEQKWWKINPSYAFVCIRDRNCLKCAPL